MSEQAADEPCGLMGPDMPEQCGHMGPNMPEQCGHMGPDMPEQCRHMGPDMPEQCRHMGPDMPEQCGYVGPDMLPEQRGHVGIWWFPGHFCQSRFGDRNSVFKRSNACTLIALLMAHRCYFHKIKIQSNVVVNRHVLNAFGRSIEEGNDIHERLQRSGELKHVNMSVPEAIDAAGKKKMRLIVEWKSLVYLMDLRDTLYESLNETLALWRQNPPNRCASDLYVILIADNRSVLFVVQKELDKVTLLDSHQHQQHGAVMAQVATCDLEMLCTWYARMVRTCYDSRPDCYELSYLYFKSLENGDKMAREKMATT